MVYKDTLSLIPHLRTDDIHLYEMLKQLNDAVLSLQSTINSGAIPLNYLFAQQTGTNPTLTTTAQDIQGCKVSLTKAGIWLLLVVSDLATVTTNFGVIVSVVVDNDTFLSPAIISTVSQSPAGSTITVQTSVAGHWIFTSATGTEVIKLVASTVVGTSSLQNTSLAALYLHP